jgi:tRNA U34 5-carboxymethylaminomethyl modifying GTPase MnmE/TrmE
LTLTLVVIAALSTLIRLSSIAVIRVNGAKDYVMHGHTIQQRWLPIYHKARLRGIRTNLEVIDAFRHALWLTN